jgi:hypothetical protein
MTALLTGCTSGKDSDTVHSEELTAFRGEVDAFCESIADCDKAINAIDTTQDGYATVLMTDLYQLQDLFTDFAAKDFPSDYDYLESLADEAAEYMTTAVDAFGNVYNSDDLTQSMMDAQYEYAMENYSRAYKRITVIVKFLNGEVDADATVTTE